jgi:hypothetical protein
LNFIGSKRGQRSVAAADENMFHLDPVFFEDTVVQRNIEMGKPAGDRACRDPHLNRLFPGLGQIGIGLGWNAEDTDRKNRYQKTLYDSIDSLR